MGFLYCLLVELLLESLGWPVWCLGQQMDKSGFESQSWSQVSLESSYHVGPLVSLVLESLLLGLGPGSAWACLDPWSMKVDYGPKLTVEGLAMGSVGAALVAGSTRVGLELGSIGPDLVP